MTDPMKLADELEECALYNFDSVEMVECKHALWKRVSAYIRASALPQAGEAEHGAQNCNPKFRYLIARNKITALVDVIDAKSGKVVSKDHPNHDAAEKFASKLLLALEYEKMRDDEELPTATDVRGILAKSIG